MARAQWQPQRTGKAATRTLMSAWVLSRPTQQGPLKQIQRCATSQQVMSISPAGGRSHFAIQGAMRIDAYAIPHLECVQRASCSSAARPNTATQMLGMGHECLSHQLSLAGLKHICTVHTEILYI